MLEKNGYAIKSLNTINFRKSMHYNPFAYIRSEKDILKLVNTIIVNTKGDGDKSGEDFWVKAEKLYYTALIGYIWYEAPEHEKNFTTLLEMINASEAREDDENFKNPVDIMFDELEARDPDHFAVKQYRKYKLAAGGANVEDAQIVQLYFRRSEEAISQTQRKYGAYLHEIACNILRSQEDSEEVVGDTYLAAWNSIPPEKPRMLRHFLSRITRNLSFDRLDYNHAQKRNTHMTTLLSELEDCLPDARQNVEAHWETKQITVCLNRFLSTLPQTDCAIFVSRYFYGKTTEEISRQYGLPPRKVTYRLSRLRQQLRCRLEQEGIAV